MHIRINRASGYRGKEIAMNTQAFAGARPHNPLEGLSLDLNPPTTGKTSADYYLLQAELNSVTNGHLYLTDEAVDAENCRDAGLERDSAEWWDCMYRNAAMNAGMRAEELGLDINVMLGRVIY